MSDKTKKVAEIIARVWADPKKSVDEAAEEITNLIFEGRTYKPKNPTPVIGKGYDRHVPHKTNGAGNGHDPHPIGFLTGAPVDKRTVAKAQGYTGQVCGVCGSFNTRQNGSCLMCTDCHNTSGCS